MAKRQPSRIWSLARRIPDLVSSDAVRMARCMTRSRAEEANGAIDDRLAEAEGVRASAPS